MKTLILITLVTLFATKAVTETNEEKFVGLLEFVSAQGHCSSYANYTFDEYSLAGFSSKEAAKKAAKKHSELAFSGSEDILSYARDYKLIGELFLTKEGQSYCFMRFAR